MRPSRLALLLAIISFTAISSAATPPTAPAPHTLLMHMAQFKLDVSLQVPSGWQLQRLPSGYPLVYLPPDSGNQPAAAWTFEFRQNDIGTTSDAVLKHLQSIAAGNHDLTIDETGTGKTPDGHETGFIRFHPGSPQNAMVRSYFIIVNADEILWINEQTRLVPWSEASPTLSAISNSLVFKPIH